MSDHSEPAACSGMLRGSEIRGPQDPRQLRWMGHCKNNGSVSAASIHGNPSGNAHVLKKECARRPQSLQLLESKETGIGNVQMSDHGALPLTSDALCSLEGVTGGKGTVNISGKCARRENTRAFGSERMVLSKTSVCKMESSCMDWKNVDSSLFLESGIVGSSWQRYMEFKINQKTQSIVRSKRKSGFWGINFDRARPQTTEAMFALTPDKVKSMTEEFQLQGEHMVQNNRKFYRFSEKKRLSCCGTLQNNFVGSTSGSAPSGFSQMPDKGPSIFTKEENSNPIASIANKEKLANNNCLNLQQEACEPCQNNLFTFSKKKGDEKVFLGCPWPIPRNRSPKAHDDFPMDVSGSNLSRTRGSMRGFMELNEPFCAQHDESDVDLGHSQGFQQRVPGFCTQDIGAPKKYTNIDSLDRLVGVPPHSSKSLPSLLVAKRSDVKLPKGDRILMTPESEEITRISKLASSPTRCPRTLEISVNDDKKDGQSIGTHPSNVQSECPARTACLETDAHKEKHLPSGVTYARVEKKVMGNLTSTRADKKGPMQDTGKTEFTSALQRKGAIISNQETALLETIIDFSPCMATHDSMDPRGFGASRTYSTDIGHAISLAEEPEKSDSSHQLENHMGPGMNGRWVKRLKVKSDSLALDTGDYNMEDVLTTQRVHKLFSRVMNYSRSNSFTMAKCLQECQQFQKTVFLLRNSDSPVESLKESHPWIQRWCQKCRETSRLKTREPTEVLCEPEKTKSLPENLEGKLFPSLGAMALMGKAINNFRPCEVRRRGSSLVWHTEGF